MYIANKRIVHLITLIIIFLSTHYTFADDRRYLFEVGAQGGLGYYVGDATEHIFNNIQPAYGAQLRYKIAPRWAVQLKGQGQKIAFPLQDGLGNQLSTKGSNQLANIDVVGEFNFFRFGQRSYDTRIKSITPYIFIGVGVSLYSDFQEVAAYLPFGLGLKWKFAKFVGLNVAWQQQLYFADNLENINYYNNTYQLNGRNFLKNDFTSSLTIGIVFEFGKTAKNCRICND